jgi:hypothetical protein
LLVAIFRCGLTVIDLGVTFIGTEKTLTVTIMLRTCCSIIPVNLCGTCRDNDKFIVVTVNVCRSCWDDFTVNVFGVADGQFRDPDTTRRFYPVAGMEGS